MCSRLSRWEVSEDGSFKKKPHRFHVPQKWRTPFKTMSIFLGIGLAGGMFLGIRGLEDKTDTPVQNKSFATPMQSFYDNRNTYLFPSQDTGANASAPSRSFPQFGSPAP